nr:MAG TPA: Cytosine specific methyltransferase [Caudoviricetes sp.]
MRRELTYATVCSGVECMSAAAIGLPLRPVFFSEIEPFPCAVLKHRFPHVPNLGDMSRITVNEKGEITNGRTAVALPAGLDILAGGTPCQDVSCAGKLRGMQEGSGTRSSLAFEFVRLIRELRPRYVVWENVAGVLSDESFPKFLCAIADCGYGVAYRTLDAQFVRCADIDLPDGGVVRLERAVPQRRRRVWVVGCAGEDIGRASEILFEPQGVCGDRPPRRVTGQGTAEAARGRARLPDCVVGRASGFDPYEPGGVKSLNPGHAGTLINGSCPGCHSGVVEVYENHAQDCRVKPCGEVAPTLNGKMGTGGNNVPLKAECFVKVSHARGADGLGERWERGECAGTRNAVEGGDGRSQECVVLTNSNGEDVSPTLSRDCRSTGNQIEKNGGYVLERRVLSCGEGASPSPAVLAQNGTAPHAVCFGINANGVTKTAQMPCREECAETLAVRHQGGVLVPNVADMRYVVRRLTPTECERLMGLPDGWTLPVFAPDEITDALVAEFVEIFDTFGSIMAGYAGKNPPKPKTATWVRKWLERIANPATCPDAPRYKACGNGWAANQPRWILLRVLAEEGIDPWNFEKGEIET